MKNPMEKLRKDPESEKEKLEVPEMSPEDLTEMTGQIPVLREILREREERLVVLEGDFNASDEELAARRSEIEELREEIEGREEAL